MPKTIPLTQGKVAIVDDADFECLNIWNWYAIKAPSTFYAVRMVSLKNSKRRMILMHRQILNPSPGMEGDHVNGDGLDNRRLNLRVCTHSQNMMNQKKRVGCSSQYIGVHWHKQRKKWYARIQRDGIRHSLGLFTNETDAARAYNAAAPEYHGEFARLNPIGETL